MAELSLKALDNVLGAFYVDSTCIDCDQCRSHAPAFFKRNDDGGHTYVWRQPETPEEITLAEEAKDICPTESIGNDGSK